MALANKVCSRLKKILNINFCLKWRKTACIGLYKTAVVKGKDDVYPLCIKSLLDLNEWYVAQ